MSPKVRSAEDVFRPLQSQEAATIQPESKPGARNWLREVGFYCALALIFLRYSFLSDYITLSDRERDS
jgi:hypothetical protein